MPRHQHDYNGYNDSLHSDHPCAPVPAQCDGAVRCETVYGTWQCTVCVAWRWSARLRRRVHYHAALLRLHVPTPGQIVQHERWAPAQCAPCVRLRRNREGVRVRSLLQAPATLPRQADHHSNLDRGYYHHHHDNYHDWHHNHNHGHHRHHHQSVRQWHCRPRNMCSVYA